MEQVAGPREREGGSDASHLLVASRRLLILDELRVPYACAPPVGAGVTWQSLAGAQTSRALHWYSGADGIASARCTIRGIPVSGGIAGDAAVGGLVHRLGGDWSPWPALEVLDTRGMRCSSAWRNGDGGTILPFDPDRLVLDCRAERYRARHGGASAWKTFARWSYYRIRGLLPRPLQIALRRVFSRVQARATFPRWPVEPALHDLSELILSCAAHAAAEDLPYLAPWPNGHTWALVLTHDVETARGRDAIERVRAVEASVGLRSAWNLVPERYAVPDDVVARLRAEGCETGVHGLRHDGRDLESLATLAERLPKMRRWASRWEAVGFRAPATQRVWEWMPVLGFDYDSSYPDTDPFEPIAGGCCTWLPFFNGDLVELPITLPQDHTLFVILRRDDRLWHEKADALRRRGGMALLITHPDYMLGDEHLAHYERFLRAYGDDATAWCALPREVSAWWRRRAETSIVAGADGWAARGPGADEARIRLVRPGLSTTPSHPASDLAGGACDAAAGT